MIDISQKVLYVTSDNVYLHLQGESLVLKQEQDEKLRLPLNGINQIIIMGNTTISNYLIRECSKVGITLSYIDGFGKFIGRFYGSSSGNVFLRKRQYALYDNNEESLKLCKNIILGKALNSANLLKYYSRFSKDTVVAEKLYLSATTILNQTKSIKNMVGIDELRGLEGVISSIYFKSFDSLLKTKEPDMLFKVRSKRPPLNNCNALLSLFYTLYTLNVTGALESFGLDSQLGYLHRMHSGRASLSCDMMEEFRSPIVDRFVVKITNLSQVVSKDFEKTEDGVVLTNSGRKKVIQLWESYKNEEIFHPLLKKNIKIKVIPYIQAQFLAQFIRGDIESYPPFYYKLS